MDKKILVTGFGYVFSEPPSKNTLESFIEDGFEVSVIHLKKFSIAHQLFPVENIETHIPKFWNVTFDFVKKIIEWLNYKQNVKTWLVSRKNCYIWCVHLTALAAIDFNIVRKNGHKVICNVVDIPSQKYSGFYDKWRNFIAYRNSKFCFFNVASDKYKALLYQKYGDLKILPLTLHNCPRLDKLKILKKAECKQWLFDSLIDKGFSISNDSVILLRAGAIGKFGGIEETILAIKKMPTKVIFLMMGRPDDAYRRHLLNFIEENKVSNRVYFFNRPNDIEWQKILLAADIGHLIHVRPDNSSAAAAMFDLNSSLSNNRLFQYMAAGLPIIAYKDERMEALYNEVKCFQVVDTNNLQAELVKAITFLEKNKAERLQLGINGYNAFLNTYNWEHQFEYIKSKICF